MSSDTNKMRHNNSTLIQAGSYLELLYTTTLIFNIANIVISIFLLPIAIKPIILVSVIAIIPLFVLMIRNLLPSKPADAGSSQPKNWLTRTAENLVHWYSNNIANHWLPKLIWDVILAFGVSSSLYSIFTYYDVSLGIHKLSLFSQLSMIGGGLFLITQIANYFMKGVTDPDTKKVSKTIEVINQSLIFALTSIVTVGSLYAQVYFYGVNVLLLSVFVALTTTISVYYTLAKQEQSEVQENNRFSELPQSEQVDDADKALQTSSVNTEKVAADTLQARHYASDNPVADAAEQDETELYLDMQRLLNTGSLIP
jgi:hypothetical protein